MNLTEDARNHAAKQGSAEEKLKQSLEEKFHEFTEYGGGLRVKA